MQMDSKIIGGILLIVGTSIGGGMLALPITTAGSGFISSSLLMLVCWMIMTFSAFLILEVNLWLPRGTNMLSMGRATLGKPGEIAVLLSYVLLLYALLAAYISGGSSVFNDFLSLFNWKIPATVSSILFVIVFGYIVYRGIKPVDYVNRGLMITKLGALLVLILFTLPYLDKHKLVGGDPRLLASTVTVMMTSFGYATIVPSLRSYFNDDVKKLRLAILIGSLIPLFCYILWDFTILGTLPRTGKNSLMEIMQQNGSTAELTQSLSYYLHNASITAFSRLFTAICVLTSFLGVSLGLFDFVADGLKVKKADKGNWLVCAITFLPSLIVVLFYPSIFVKALSYAGIFCVILVVLLPALMAWSGRYRKQLANHGAYQVLGGRVAIMLVILVAIAIIGLGIVQMIP